MSWLAVVRQAMDAFKRWWSGPLAKVGAVLTVLAFVSKWVGTGKLWLHIVQWAWDRIGWLKTDGGRLSLLVVGLGLIAWDQHRRGKPKLHDLQTVKGRTLQLRDDLQNLLDDARAKWPEYVQGKTVEPYNDSHLEDAFRRGSYIQHTFALKFESRAMTIYHECGLAGTANDKFMFRMANGIANSSSLQELIENLDWTIKHVD
jgi:hypothetical protein